ncbi:hypothetical protein [Fodinibius halophilus]|uniref:Uncharacterized protein n=1 Tax=Fodinibius halophilus TaxID=1736908 RepID=A0A6M1T3L0_9BACT|nr:hypothetical protein [Fodinibius halophilus]NGP87223.1 hypothetical protein [Fodinibius halophilus]
MKLYKFIGYLIGSFLGILLYELMVYYTGPYTVDWLDLILQGITIATAIAITMVFSQRWGKETSQ